MGFTLMATLDEYGEWVSQFVLPFALTDDQQEHVAHGAIDWAGTVETYFVTDPDHDATDEHAVNKAGDLIAELHVLTVKSGAFA